MRGIAFWEENQGKTFTVNGKVLGNVLKLKDPGIKVYSSLKMALQLDRVVKKSTFTRSENGALYDSMTFGLS